LIDGIVPEPGEGAHSDPDNAAEALGHILRETLAELAGKSPQQLIRERYEKIQTHGLLFLRAHRHAWVIAREEASDYRYPVFFSRLSL